MIKYEENMGTDTVEVTEEDHIILYELNKQEEYEDSVQKYRRIAQAAIAQWIKDFKDERIKINSVDDLERLIKIDLKLQKGEF